MGTKIWNYYEIKGDSLIHLKKDCPRCGKGFFLGEHKDRFTCGKCSYTSWKGGSNRP